MPAFDEAWVAQHTDERDARWLAGGNFFGRELNSEPYREPLAIDQILAEQEAAAKAAAAAPQPLMLKLPGKSAKTP